MHLHLHHAAILLLQHFSISSRYFSRLVFLDSWKQSSIKTRIFNIKTPPPLFLTLCFLVCVTVVSVWYSMSGEEDGSGWIFGLTFIGTTIAFVLGMGVWSSQNPYQGIHWQQVSYESNLLCAAQHLILSPCAMCVYSYICLPEYFSKQIRFKDICG